MGWWSLNRSASINGSSREKQGHHQEVQGVGFNGLMLNQAGEAGASRYAVAQAASSCRGVAPRCRGAWLPSAGGGESNCRELGFRVRKR